MRANVEGRAVHGTEEIGGVLGKHAVELAGRHVRVRSPHARQQRAQHARVHLLRRHLHARRIAAVLAAAPRLAALRGPAAAAAALRRRFGRLGLRVLRAVGGLADLALEREAEESEVNVNELCGEARTAASLLMRQHHLIERHHRIIACATLLAGPAGCRRGLCAGAGMGRRGGDAAAWRAQTGAQNEIP